MKESFLKYYYKVSPLAQLVFMKDIVFTKSGLRKQALMNRLKDYQKIGFKENLFALHRRLSELLLESMSHWESYDYGEGYFYQGLKAISVTGFRDTDERVQMMDLKNLLRGKGVLEIGCNTGFLSCSIAETAKSVDAFDINPYCVEIGKETAKYLGYANIDFSINSFEAFTTDKKFDAVLSFANHSTFDQNTKYSLKEYFGKCAELMSSGGLFLFESHPPEHEGDGLQEVISLIGDIFQIKEQKILQYGSFLDRNRTFIIASKP